MESVKTRKACVIRYGTQEKEYFEWGGEEFKRIPDFERDCVEVYALTMIESEELIFKHCYDEHGLGLRMIRATKSIESRQRDIIQKGMSYDTDMGKLNDEMEQLRMELEKLKRA